MSPGVPNARRADVAPPGDPAAAAAPGGTRFRDPQARHRIFVAVALAPHLREAIAGVRVRLGDASQALRWVPPDNLHLTLRFLGEITAAQVTRATEATREAVQAAAPFTITLVGLGAFPSARRPRVVWIGVAEGADRLIALAEALEKAMQRRKFPREPRAFQAHLTVARARMGSPPDLTEVLAGVGRPLIGTQEVAALVVMESDLRPSGPVYREVAQASLSGRA